MVAAFPYSASQLLTSFRNFFLIYPRGHDHVIGLLAAWALNSADWLIVQAVKAFLHTLIKWHSLSDRFLQLHKSRLPSACFWTCGTLSASVSRPFHFERCPSAFRVGAHGANLRKCSLALRTVRHIFSGHESMFARSENAVKDYN